MRFVSVEDTPEGLLLAKIATSLINRPDVVAQIDAEVSAELARQLIYNLPPSSADIPDRRPRRLRYEGRK